MARRTLKMFDENPENRPKPRAPEYAGRFRAGMQLNNRPVALSEWRVTTGDQAVADRIAGLYGGSPESWDTKKDDVLQVLTETDAVKVIVENADAVSFRMALYGMQGPVHVCDGVDFIDPEDPQFGQPCGCPSDLKAKKDGAKAGRLPKPDIRVTFHLADAPELGKFKLMTGSWDFLKSLETVWADLDAVTGPASATLRLKVVDYFSQNLGKQVTYRHPELQVHGPAESTVSAPKKSLAQVDVEEDAAPF